MSERLWAIDADTRKVPSLRTKLKLAGDSVTILYLGDTHFDNAHADRAAIKRLLDEALERDAVIVLLGDMLDLMGGRDDRRSSKSALRTEHKVDAYFTAVLDEWTDFYRPYAKNTWIALEGNHCSAVRRMHEFDPTRTWVRQLNAEGAAIDYPGYSTYARILNSAGTRREGLRFFVHHGYGGGGPVTRGAIQAARRAVLYPDANWIVTGHVHSSWNMDHEQYRLDADGKPYVAVQEHYSVGSAKDEHGDGKGGWWVEKGMGPRQKSGWWCELTYTAHRGLMWAFTKAKM
jgi:predicted phosphodiesterase